MPTPSGRSPSDWFESLHWLTTALNRSGTRRDVCSAALDVLEAALGVTRSAVLLMDSDGVMRFAFWRRLSDEYRRAVEGHSPWPLADSSPQPFAIDDACAAPSLAKVCPALAKEGIASLAFVPLLDQGRLLGKFMLYSDTSRRFTEAELRFAVAVGNHIAFAVERQRAEENQRQLQEQLQVAQRLESIGRLAGGVAHDFNNLLTAILGFSELALMKMSPGAPPCGDLQQIGVAAERAMELTRQLLAFARRQRIELQEVHLGETLQNLVRMVRRLLGEQIELVVHQGAELWPVRVDRTQMEQVILNLAVNARDAMPTGGKIAIDVRNVSLSAADAAARGEIGAGDYVQMVFEDDGVGMTADVRAHVFEPFFTTKEVGRGTGLGLSTCYGVIKQFGGHIDVESEPGRGTRFWILLPRAAGGVAQPGVVSPAKEPARARGTVLLVEDEPVVREMITKTLRAGGYSVLAAAHGVEALRVVAEHHGTIDLLFTDMVMPQMGGRELAERLLVARPQMRVLFTSGYTDDETPASGGGNFLSKPFTPTVALRRVGEILADEDDRRLTHAGS